MSIKIVQNDTRPPVGVHPHSRWCAGGLNRKHGEILHEGRDHRIGKDQRRDMRGNRRDQRQMPVQLDGIGHQHNRNVSR